MMDPIFDTLVLVRWVHFGAVFLLFGGALFFAYAPAGSGSCTSTSRACRRGLAIAAPVALATGVGWLAATIVNMTGLEGLGDPDTLHAFFFETLFGPIEIARMALLVVAATLAFMPMPDRPRTVAVAVTSALLLISQAWLGHAAEGGATLHGAIMIAAYAAHILAGAAWIGGLPPLFVRIVELRRRAAAPGALFLLLSRFSAMATLAVVVVVASGIANAAFRVQGRFVAFVATGYGDVLLGKVTLVALVLWLAAYTRFVAMPRLRSPEGESGIAARTVATSVAGEIALGAFVLLAAAVLGIMPPPGG